MSARLDELYIQWLYSQVGNVRLTSKSKTFWSMARQLYKTEFVWFVPNDDNRAEDGRDLRYEFFDQTGEELDVDWFDQPCSMFELLLGLARRLSFEAGGEPRAWFWHLLDNLDLGRVTDAHYNDDTERGIAEILDRINRRTYNRDGYGGLFPLRRPRRDQRKVELWYQLNAYIIELN
jgi:hypothetical protein